MRNRHFRSSLFLSCLVVAGLLSGLHSTAVAQADPGIRITTLSSKPDIVSGGIALVRISVPSAVPLTSVMVLLNRAGSDPRSDAVGRGITYTSSEKEDKRHASA